MLQRLLTVTVVVAACALPAAAQSVIFGESFDGVSAGTFPTGWSADAPTGTPSTGWSVDATPVDPGIATGAHSFTGGCFGFWGFLPVPATLYNSAPFSLNFNNGTDQESGGLYAGGATSPVYTVSSIAGVTLTFYCLWEGLSCDPSTFFYGLDLGTDQKFVEILDSTGSTVLLSVQLYIDGDGDGDPPFTLSAPEIDAMCFEMYQGHFHTIDLSGIGATSFRVRFRANQVAEPDAGIAGPPDDTYWSGWFIDDMTINCPLPDVAAPTVPTQISPASGATVISPVTFDWSDSTDTAPCGPGIVTYELAIDDLATVPNPDYFLTPGISTASQALPPGSYNWYVQAVDGSGNPSGFTPASPFTVEVNLAPDAPDSLFVNESQDGAQQGDAGFVDPVIDQTPAFSAVYRDPNVTPDTAIGLRFQVTDDPTFTTLVFDSGSVAISPPVPEDTRTPNLTINVNLLRDTVYYWRIQFTDAGGLTGPFSIPQSFRVGDDFEFGVRNGSSHHGRRCWVATAAYGNEGGPVSDLQGWRRSALESVPAGRVASRAYHVGGAVAADRMSAGGLIGFFAPGTIGSLAGMAMLLGALVVAAGLFRTRAQ